MKATKKFVGFALVTASFSIVGLSLKLVFADVTQSPQISSFEEQQKITPEEEKKLHDSVDAIYKKYGEFRRSTSTLNFKSDSNYSSSEIAYAEDDINSKTKKLVTDYGVFIKQ